MDTREPDGVTPRDRMAALGDARSSFDAVETALMLLIETRKSKTDLDVSRK